MSCSVADRDGIVGITGLQEVSLETKDCFGRTVRKGDRVKVLGFSEAFMKSLLPEEHAHISQMIGDVFVVEEIDDGGQACQA